MLPCPSQSSGVGSNSHPLNQWWHPTISSSVIPFSSCPQSFPGSGSFPGSQLFISGGQSIRASASASVLPMNIQDWFPLGLTIHRTLEFSLAPQFESINSLTLSLLYGPTLTSILDYWENYIWLESLDTCSQVGWLILYTSSQLFMGLQNNFHAGQREVI